VQEGLDLAARLESVRLGSAASGGSAATCPRLPDSCSRPASKALSRRSSRRYAIATVSGSAASVLMLTIRDKVGAPPEFDGRASCYVGIGGVSAGTRDVDDGLALDGSWPHQRALKCSTRSGDRGLDRLPWSQRGGPSWSVVWASCSARRRFATALASRAINERRAARTSPTSAGGRGFFSRSVRVMVAVSWVRE
jgi:hypothetical protein